MPIDMKMAGWVAALLPLAACGGAADAPARNPVEAVTARPPAIGTRGGGNGAAAVRSCAVEIGAAAAARRVAICRHVSPATHPPCNAANSCAAMDHEIARSCALFAGDVPRIEECGPNPAGREAAADVVRRYYAAIDARDYPTAWIQWGDDGRPGQSFAAFRDGFSRTLSTRVAIGTPGPMEGAAGSVYSTVPVTVDAVLADGTRQRFEGAYILRRANGVDGADAAMRRWHIDSAQLKSVDPD